MTRTRTTMYPVFNGAGEGLLWDGVVEVLGEVLGRDVEIVCLVSGGDVVFSVCWVVFPDVADV